MTNREAHEKAAGMNLEMAFFTTNGIDPDAEYTDACYPEDKEERDTPKKPIVIDYDEVICPNPDCSCKLSVLNGKWVCEYCGQKIDN